MVCAHPGLSPTWPNAPISFLPRMLQQASDPGHAITSYTQLPNATRQVSPSLSQVSPQLPASIVSLTCQLTHPLFHPTCIAQYEPTIPLASLMTSSHQLRSPYPKTYSPTCTTILSPVSYQLVVFHAAPSLLQRTSLCSNISLLQPALLQEPATASQHAAQPTQVFCSPYRLTLQTRTPQLLVYFSNTSSPLHVCNTEPTVTLLPRDTARLLP